MITAKPSKSGYLLIVEGQDDYYVVKALCKRWETTSDNGSRFDVNIFHRRGFNGILDAIPIHTKDEAIKSLGILFDGDSNPQKRWGDVRHQLREAYDQLTKAQGGSPCEEDYDYVSELEIRAGGIVIPGNPSLGPPVPCVGAWMMPDNGSPGELEDFVIGMVPEGDKVFRLASAYIDGIPEGERKFAEDKTRKAELYAWLAARREPGRMGYAIDDGDLSAEGEGAKRFLEWLRRVFPPEGAASP